MLKFQILLMAVLIAGFAFMSCDRAQQVMTPVADDMMDSGSMSDDMKDDGMMDDGMMDDGMTDAGMDGDMEGDGMMDGDMSDDMDGNEAAQ